MPSNRGARVIINVRLDAQPDVIRACRKLVAAAARAMGVPRKAVFELEIAIGEALANAYDHAYQGGRCEGPISVHLTFRQDGLAITVSDAGERRHTSPRIPRDVPLAAERGRGLFLMSRLMDDVEVVQPVRGGKGTAVRMMKRLRPRSPVTTKWKEAMVEMTEEKRKRDRRGEPVAPTSGEIEREIDPTRRRPSREPEGDAPRPPAPDMGGDERP